MAGARRPGPALRRPPRHRERHVVRGVGAQRARRTRRRRLQPVGRSDAPDAIARLHRRLGAVRPRRRRRHPLQVRGARLGRRAPAQGRPDGPGHGDATGHRVTGLLLPLHLGRRRLDGSAQPREPPPGADEHLRGAPGLVAAGAVLRPAGRRAGRLRLRPRVHPRRAAARGGAPVPAVLGLPGDGLLRPHLALRHPRRVPAARGPPAPGRDRRHPRLGARALPQGRLGAGEVRRSGSLRARRPSPRRAARLGHAGLRLRAQGGPQLPGRQRRVLARGVPHRRSARRRGRLDALPRLQPRGRGVGAEHLRRPREPRGRGLPPGGQRHRLQAGRWGRRPSPRSRRPGRA